MYNQPDSPMIFDNDFNDHNDVYKESPIKNSSKIEEAAITFLKNSPYLSSDDNSYHQSNYICTTKTAKHKSSGSVESFDEIKANLPVVKHKKVKKKKKSLKKKVKKDRKNREKGKKEKSKSKSLTGRSEVFASPQIKVVNIVPSQNSPEPKPVHHQVVTPPTKKETKAVKQKQSSKHEVKSSAKQSKLVESHDETEKEPSANYNYQNKSRVMTQTVIEVWYCPACGGPDDGSLMIGCDGTTSVGMCDNWYHYPCVNITETPAEDEKWYCPNCTKSKKSEKKKKKH